MSQSLLEVREAVAVRIPQEVAALEESRRNIKVLRGRRPRRCRCSGVEARRTHASQIIVFSDRLLLAADLHLFVLFVSVLPVDLLELHRDLAQLVQRLPSQHHLLAVPQVAVEKLLHHIHVIDDERVQPLEVSRWIQLRHEVNLEWRVIDRLAAFRILIGFEAAGKATRKLN